MTCKKPPPAPTTAFSPTPERRSSSPERLFRPLALGLEAKALADLLEGSLHLPASHKPGDDLLRLGSEVGAQQSLSLELLLRVADQDPTQGHGGQTRAVPERCPGNDLYGALAVAVPVVERDRRPVSGWVFREDREVW